MSPLPPLIVGIVPVACCLAEIPRPPWINGAVGPGIRSRAEVGQGLGAGQLIGYRQEEPDRSGHFQAVAIRRTQGKYPLVRTVVEHRIDPVTGQAQIVRSTSMVADHIIVRLKPGASIAEFRKQTKQAGTRIRKASRIRGLFLVETEGSDPESIPRAVAHWKTRPGVRYAEPDYVLEAQIDDVDDPYFAEQWALHNDGSVGLADADIDAPEAWEIRSEATDVIVGVIDTGIDMSHPDLAQNIWTHPGEVVGDLNGDGFPGIGGVDDDGDGLIDEDSLGNSRFEADGTLNPEWIGDLADDDDENGYADDLHGWDFANDDNDPTDDHFHGTCVAGIIGAVGNNGIGISGVARRVSLVPLKFMQPTVIGSASGLVSEAAEAVRYAADIGASITANSWGGSSYSQTLEDAIRDAAAAGVLFVAAAGNSGTDNDLNPVYPAGYAVESLVSVAATDEWDALAVFSSTQSSNFGAATVHLGAPGQNIFSTLPVDPTPAMVRLQHPAAYGRLSGTSMAVPHVVGVCALVKSALPELSPVQIKEVVCGAGDRLPELIGRTVSGARLNAWSALRTAAAPCVAIGSVAAQESTGNQDGILNPGETIALAITLKNVGALPTDGVTATLASLGPEALVVEGTETQPYGRLEAYASAAPPERHLVALSASLATPQLVVLELTVTDAEGRTWSRPVAIRIYTSSRISGVVTLDGAGLADALITCSGRETNTVHTAADGSYSFLAIDGTWTVSAAYPGAVAAPGVQVLVPPTRTGVDFAFRAVTLTGRVVDDAGNTVTGAAVRYWGDVAGEVQASDGTYTLSLVFGRSAPLFMTAKLPGAYLPAAIRRVNIPPYQQTIDFSLTPHPGYTILDIGTLEGGQESLALDVNDRGEVVGWAADAEGVVHAIIYDIWHGLRSLGADSTGTAVAQRINGQGDVAGRLNLQATAWYEGLPVNLGAFADGLPSEAAGINSDGAVVGHSRVAAESPAWRAFLFRDLDGNRRSDAGEMLDLGTLGGPESRAEAINDRGEVVGSAITSDGSWRAFVFRDDNANHMVDEGETMVLSTLYGPGSSPYLSSLAADINRSGQVVGYAPGPAGTHAFLFTDENQNRVEDAGEMVDLGDLGVEKNGISIAFALNDQADVVGSAQEADQWAFEGFLWQQGVLRNLHDLIASDEWFLNAPCGINNRGWIAGFGHREGWARGFLLVPYADCNANGHADISDIADRLSLDCNRNAVPDACDIAEGTLADLDLNGVADICQVQAVAWSSVLTHAAENEVAIPLNPGGTAARGLSTEPRAGGVRLLRVELNRPAVLIGDPTVSGSDGSQVLPSFSLLPDGVVLEIRWAPEDVVDGVCYTVDLSAALIDRDTGAPVVADAECTFRCLEGDVDGDGAVTEADVWQVSTRIGVAVDPATGRFDCDRDGLISGEDVAWVRTRLGRSAFCTSEPTVVGRHIFYSGSRMKTAEELTPAPDKLPLLPGATASFSNISSFNQGLTGIFVDIANLPDAPIEDDFEFRMGNSADLETWLPAPLPQSISVMPGQGNGGSTRVMLVWRRNAIATLQWLQIVVKASERTGLASNDVFYYGSLIGEIGLGNTPSAAFVSEADWSVVQASYSLDGHDYRPITEVCDFNRDSLVNGADHGISVSHVGDPITQSLILFTAPQDTGFDPPAPLAWACENQDYDGDRNVDDDDFSLFQACATGPAIPYGDSPPPGCTLAAGTDGTIQADFDHDGDVDGRDFGAFQRCYSSVAPSPDE